MKLSDVTLREGDQLPGRDYTVAQKVECARTIDEIGLSFIQPAFPATGEKDQAVLEELSGTTDAEIVALARAREQDIDLAVDAGADIVDIFVPLSDLQLDHLVGKSRQNVLDALSDAVEHTRRRGTTPHVTLTDAFRTPPSGVAAALEHVPNVPIVTLADTVGARTPQTVQAFLDELSTFTTLERLGVHFHNDMGCATANALTASSAGITKVDVSVASLGERAGNTALEEFVVGSIEDLDNTLSLDTSALIPSCRHVLDVLGEEYDDRKPILGRGIAEHESGLHVAAMLQDPATLESFDPTDFGGTRRLLFGSSTGARAAGYLLKQAGVQVTEERLSTVRSHLSEAGPLAYEDAIDLVQSELPQS